MRWSAFLAYSIELRFKVGAWASSLLASLQVSCYPSCLPASSGTAILDEFVSQ